MPPAGFEPAIPAGERLQTLALDRSATLEMQNKSHSAATRMSFLLMLFKPGGVKRTDRTVRQCTVPSSTACGWSAPCRHHCDCQDVRWQQIRSRNSVATPCVTKWYDIRWRTAADWRHRNCKSCCYGQHIGLVRLSVIMVLCCLPAQSGPTCPPERLALV